VTVLAAVLAALAVAALGLRAPRRAAPVSPGRPPPVRRPRAVPPPVAVASAAVAAYLAAGPRAGLAVAPAVAFGAHRLLAALPTRADAERDRARAAAVPLLADLVAACVAAGAPVDAALAAAAHAVGPPLGDEVARAVRAARLGASAPTAWAPLLGAERPPPVRAFARAVVRAEAGAAPAVLLRAVADDARAAARTAGEVAARRAGVLAVLPLGLCFLPAFVLVGVVPLVATLVAGVIG